MSIPANAPAFPAEERYGSLVFQDRPVHDGDLFSRRHPRMSRLNRAKLFAPFAALAGFDERVRRKEVAYVPKHELDADEAWALNRSLCALHGLTSNSRLARTRRVQVGIEYFELCGDEENDAYQVRGVYKTLTGIAEKVDPEGQCLNLQAGGQALCIPFSDIYRIWRLPDQGPSFPRRL